MSETPEYQPEQPREKIEYQYTNEKGDVICTAKVELGLDKTEMIHGKTEHVRQLHSLILEAHSKEGQPIGVDVLSIANPHNLTILVSEDDVGTYLVDKRTVVAPQPQTQVDLATLLHELGHGDQLISATVASVFKLDRTSSSIACMQFEKLPGRLRQIAKAVPRTQEKIEKIPIVELEELAARYKKHDSEEDQHMNLWSQLYEKSKLVNAEIATEQSLGDKSDEEYEHLGDLMCESEALEKQMDIESGEASRNYRERKKIEQLIKSIIKKYKISTILNIPTILQEADATQRAVRWMKQVKDSGVDIIIPQKLSEKQLESFLQHKCKKDEVVIEDPTQTLNRYLETYRLNHHKWAEKRKKQKTPQSDA